MYNDWSCCYGSNVNPWHIVCTLFCLFKESLLFTIGVDQSTTITLPLPLFSSYSASNYFLILVYVIEISLRFGSSHRFFRFQQKFLQNNVICLEINLKACLKWLNPNFLHRNESQISFIITLIIYKLKWTTGKPPTQTAMPKWPRPQYDRTQQQFWSELILFGLDKIADMPNCQKQRTQTQKLWLHSIHLVPVRGCYETRNVMKQKNTNMEWTETHEVIKWHNIFDSHLVVIVN